RFPSSAPARELAAMRRQTRRQAPGLRWRAATSAGSRRWRGRGSLLLALAHRGKDSLVRLVVAGLAAGIARRVAATAVYVQLVPRAAAQHENSRTSGLWRGGRAGRFVFL